jgi:hypothetical protein
VKTAVAFAVVALVQIAIFFNNPRHFFMADTVLWMGYRYQSIGEFFSGFLQVDQMAWYRPLAQKTVMSLLFPFAGLNPLPYRIVGFLLFFSCTILVFLFVRQVTESRRAAWLAVLFFAPQVTHAFTTYDAAFTPEIVYTLFYIGSAMAYVSYLRTHRSGFLILSVGLFAGSLLSKESAVALPLTLGMIWLLLPRKERGRVRSLAPHFALLAVYLVFAIGYLHIRDIKVGQILEQPDRLGQPGYQLVVGKQIPENFDIAFGWAFGIPRGTYTEDMIPNPWMQAALKWVRALICVGAVFVLFTGQGNLMLLGLGWFVTALLPTVPLSHQFLPYYLFAPLVGFSLAMGVVLDWAYAQCSRIQPALGVGLCALVLALPAAIQASAANQLATKHRVLGGSAMNAENSMRDLQRLYPSLPKSTLIVILNEEEPVVSWDQADGRLFQMAYADPSIAVTYTGDNLHLPLERFGRENILVLRWTNQHLVDFTSIVRQRPDVLRSHLPNVVYRLELSKGEVRAGETYTMRVPELANQIVTVLYAFNGMVKEPFAVKLDVLGEAKFEVNSETPPGTYMFAALRRETGEGETGWVTVSKSITVK